MGKNRVFFSQAALDQLIVEGKVDLIGDELTLKAEGRRYRILEAARIVSEVSGTADGNELLGKVKTRAYLSELGAELLETSMVLGDNAYEVVPGFLGAPVGTLQEHLTERGVRPGANIPASDEEILARYLLETV
jgi:hypothetical protein